MRNSNFLELRAREWEAVRHQFQNDARTLGEREAATGELRRIEDGGSRMATGQDEVVAVYAVRSWDELSQMRGVGAGRRRTLVEMFAAAGGG